MGKLLATFEGRVPPGLGQEGNVEVCSDDGGKARIVEIFDPSDDARFVRIQSWDGGREHGWMRPFYGRRVRVTIEDVSDD